MFQTDDVIVLLGTPEHMAAFDEAVLHGSDVPQTT